MTIRNLAELVWLWIRITVVLAVIAFAAGAVMHAMGHTAATYPKGTT